MRRRNFIKGIGSSAAAWPLVARAQPPALPVIGFLHTESADRSRDRLRGFHQGLAETGYVEGRNQTFASFIIMSALPPKADIVQYGGNVRFVPKADSCTAPK